MVKQIQMKLSESKTARWSVLALVAFTMLCGYFITDMMAPLQDLLQTPVMSGGLGWSGDDYGKFTSAYGWFNVFLLMLIFGGMILDKMGVRFTGLMATGIMLVGVFIKWFGISHDFGGETVSIFGTEWGYPLLIASLGYALFGVGIEIAGITVSKIIVKWFKGKEMALAMGLEMAIARIGVAAAVLISPAIANMGGVKDVSRSVLFCVILLLIGFIAFCVYFVMDKKLEKQMGESGEEPEEPFQIKDLGLIFSSKVFWIVALLCVLYYSAIFPFQKYAINMLQCNLDFTAEKAGMIFSVFPLGAAAITPLLGNFLDRKGKGASMLIYGAFLMIICHLAFALALPALKGSIAGPIVAFTSIVLLGISFSLVPAALWPSVQK